MGGLRGLVRVKKTVLDQVLLPLVPARLVIGSAFARHVHNLPSSTCRPPAAFTAFSAAVERQCSSSPCTQYRTTPPPRSGWRAPRVLLTQQLHGACGSLPWRPHPAVEPVHQSNRTWAAPPDSRLRRCHCPPCVTAIPSRPSPSQPPARGPPTPPAVAGDPCRIRTAGRDGAGGRSGRQAEDLGEPQGAATDLDTDANLGVAGVEYVGVMPRRAHQRAVARGGTRPTFSPTTRQPATSPARSGLWCRWESSAITAACARATWESSVFSRR